tara:strand:- start:1169 stop:1726 length:558 start_codon:yes stop_codon:yes gene_type:complete
MSNPNLEGLEKIEKYDDKEVSMKLSIRFYLSYFYGDQLNDVDYRRAKKWLLNEMSVLNKKLMKQAFVDIAMEFEKEFNDGILGFLGKGAREKKMQLVKQILKAKFGEDRLKMKTKVIYEDKEVDALRKELFNRTLLKKVKKMAGVPQTEDEIEWWKAYENRESVKKIQARLALEQMLKKRYRFKF